MITMSIYGILTNFDSNGIPTSVELQNHLDPFNSADAEADLDNDGLSNIFEYKHNLSITDKETDHDGIDDGEELKYWNETRNLWLSTAIDYCKDPDVDRVGWKSDGTPISEMIFISPDELDPLKPYANEDGVYTDSDEDCIPDVVEIYLSNSSKWNYFWGIDNDESQLLNGQVDFDGDRVTNLEVCQHNIADWN